MMPEQEVAEYGTPFQETEALLAVGNKDQATAFMILGEMSPGELGKLAADAHLLAELADGFREGAR
jgi:hypothetical protein